MGRVNFFIQFKRHFKHSGIVVEDLLNIKEILGFLVSVQNCFNAIASFGIESEEVIELSTVQFKIHTITQDERVTIELRFLQEDDSIFVSSSKSQTRVLHAFFNLLLNIANLEKELIISTYPSPLVRDEILKPIFQSLKLARNDEVFLFIPEKQHDGLIKMPSYSDELAKDMLPSMRPAHPVVSDGQYSLNQESDNHIGDWVKRMEQNKRIMKNYIANSKQKQQTTLRKTMMSSVSVRTVKSDELIEFKREFIEMTGKHYKVKFSVRVFFTIHSIKGGVLIINDELGIICYGDSLLIASRNMADLIGVYDDFFNKVKDNQMDDRLRSIKKTLQTLAQSIIKKS